MIIFHNHPPNKVEALFPGVGSWGGGVSLDSHENLESYSVGRFWGRDRGIWSGLTSSGIVRFSGASLTHGSCVHRDDDEDEDEAKEKYEY